MKTCNLYQKYFSELTIILRFKLWADKHHKVVPFEKQIWLYKALYDSYIFAAK